MYSTALRSLTLGAARGAVFRMSLARSTRVRFASASAASKKRGTWTGTAARWALVIAGVYWYNTSPVFQDEAEPLTYTVATAPDFDAGKETVDAIIETKRRELATLRQKREEREAAAAVEMSTTPKTTPQEKGGHIAPLPPANDGVIGKEALQEEAGQQGAFDPKTGEINWDCPCLGGMAHGPCGQGFKAAFSCFVYSKEEPKGIDCIEKFQHMQDCFRQYPDVYAAELADEEDAASPTDTPSTKETAAPSAATANSTPMTENTSFAAEVTLPAQDNKTIVEKQQTDGVPKKGFDATDANKAKGKSA